MRPKFAAIPMRGRVVKSAAQWRSEMHRLIPVKGYHPIPRLSVACAIARPRGGWVDACSYFPLLAPERRPLAMEVYLPEWDAP